MQRLLAAVASQRWPVRLQKVSLPCVSSSAAESLCFCPRSRLCTLAFPLKPKMLISSAAFWMCAKCSFLTLCIAACRDEDACKIDFATLLREISSLQAKTGIEVTHFFTRAQATYIAAAAGKTFLTFDDLDRVVHEIDALLDEQVHWSSLSKKCLSILGHVLFQMLDVEHAGRISLKSLLIGQALIYALAKAKGPADFSEVCWLALDPDSRGFADIAEIKEVVIVMAKLGSLHSQQGLGEPSAMKVLDYDYGTQPLITQHSMKDLADHYIQMSSATQDVTMTKAEFKQLLHNIAGKAKDEIDR